MASFNPTVITNKGHALMAKIVAGTATPNFTRIQTSDVDYSEPTSEQLELMTSITSTKQSVLVSNISKINQATVKVSGVLTNTELTIGYYFRAIGLYAMDPNEGEILYSITVAETPDWIPPYNDINVSSITIDLITVVSNASNINLKVDPSAVATLKQLETIPQKSFYADIEAYYGNTKKIVAFESVEDAADGVTLTQGTYVTTNRRIGGDCVKSVYDGTNAVVRTDLSQGIDLSKFNNGDTVTDEDYICLPITIEGTVPNYIVIEISTLWGSAYLNTLVTGIVTGFQRIDVRLGDVASYGGGTLSSFKTLRIYSLEGGIDTVLYLDELQIVKKDPEEAYPNPFQKFKKREFKITNGIWVICKAFGKIVMRELTETYEELQVGYEYSLQSNIQFNNFIATATKSASSERNVCALGVICDTENFITSWSDSNLLYLMVVENGIITTITKDFHLDLNDIVSYKLAKSGNAIDLRVIKNNNFENPTILNAETNLTNLRLCIGSYADKSSGYSNISITEISHAHHASTSEIAMNLSKQPLAKVFITLNQAIASSAEGSPINWMYKNPFSRGFSIDLYNYPTKIIATESMEVEIKAIIRMEANSIGDYRRAQIRKNGSVIADVQVTNTKTIMSDIEIFGDVSVNKGDYIEIWVINPFATSLNVYGESLEGYTTWMSIKKIN